MNFKHIMIDATNPRDPHCKIAGDLDGDRRADLLAASVSEGGVWWYRCPNWSKHLITEGSSTVDMAIAHIDGDGFPGVVIPEQNEGLLWFRNPRGERRDPASDPWTATNLGPQGAHMHDIELADLDGDGKIDAVTRHQSGFGSMKGNLIWIWKQNIPQDWTTRIFEYPHGEGLTLADIEGDGRLDVVIGGRGYQNPGDILNGVWQEHLFLPAEEFERGWTKGDVMVAAGDLDGDGQVEIVMPPSEGKGHLSWFDAPANPGVGFWT